MSTTLPNVDDVYPLTATQQGMLYHTLSAPESGAYVNQVLTPISGDLDVTRFERTWADILAEHETLRTGFVWDGLDDPLQIVRSDVDTEWQHLDLSESAAGEQDRQLAEWLEEDRRRGFDLANPPLCRMALVRLGPLKWKWIWSFHHLILDGWSANLILDELFATYGDADSLPGTSTDRPKFRDFVAAYLARDEAPEQAFWAERLAGFTDPHRLDVPGLPPDRDSSGYATYSLDLGAAASTSVATAARDLNVTLNALFLGAWALVLSRWTRSTDVVFGTTVAGRPSSLPGVERATGLFINTLPQRVQVRPGDRLGPWLRDVQAAQIETREHEQSSLASVQRVNDVDGTQPLFESILVFENYPRREHTNRFGGIEVGDRTYLEQSNYPLAVLVLPGDSMRIQFVYDSSAFSESAIVGLGAQLRALLNAMATHPDQRLASFCLTEEGDDAWLRKVGTGPNLPSEPTTIHEMVRRVATDSPDSTAVVDPDGSISYRDLLARSEVIARRLAATGVGPSRLVGLYLPRSNDMIAGMLGILEAGGAYVPLDPAYPAAHLQHLLAGDGIDVVVTTANLAEGLPDNVTKVLVDGESAEQVAVQPATESDLAYVMHTSGSTGPPKSVMVTHGNLVKSTQARSLHYEQPVGRFLLLSSFAFDSSVAGIFWTLTTGGTLILPAPGQERDVIPLLAVAREQEVTHTLCLPSLYELLLDSSEAGELDSLRVAIVAGEACPPPVLRAHRERLPDTQLHNEYGPTEATVWCTVHRASPADESLPVGRPIAGARVFLLDEHGNVVPPGFAGEICVAGAGVVPGYLGRPDLTAERFVSIPVLDAELRLYRTGDLGAWDSDGTLTYLGRTDAQLKIRGHRIEPGAVEATIRGLDGLRDAAVVGRSRSDGLGEQLVAFVVPKDVAIDASAVRSALRNQLPRHMVPDLIVPLDRLPRLPNGKVDLRRLPDLGQEVPETLMPPRDHQEQLLARLWAELLSVDAASIGVDSDFFDLGGDSLVAIRLTSAVHREFSKAVPLSALLDAPRLGDFATLLRDERPLSRLLVPLRGSGSDVLFMIHPGGGNVLVYEPVARQMSDRVAVVGIQARGVDGQEEPDRTFDEMAVRYADEIRKQAPTGPVNLAGYSTGGLIAFEVGRILEQEGHQVGLVALLDTVFPTGPGLPARLAEELHIIRTGRWSGLRTVADGWWGSLRAVAGKVRHGPRWSYLLSREQPLPPALAGKRITHIALAAVRRYQPSAYGGTITYVRALGDGTRFNASLPKWRAVAREVVVRDAPGQHAGEGNMVSDAHAATLAVILEEALISAIPVGRSQPPGSSA